MPSGRVLPFLHRVLRGAVLASAVTTAGCTDANSGNSPPPDRMAFPQGVLLDPRTPEGEAARYLLVTTGNNDLAYNSGWLMAFDLDAFFAAWANDPAAGDLEVYPYCDPGVSAGGGGRCVRDADGQVDPAHPCRRLPFQPRIVECEESYFVVGDGQRVGSFATRMAGSRTGTPRVWIPVRGEPSITFAEVEPAAQPWFPPSFECGADEVGDRCDRAHRLTHVRNDLDEESLAREPFSVLIDEANDRHYAYVAHINVEEMTLIDLDGVRQSDGAKSGVPAIVDSAAVFAAPATSQSATPGAYGLAIRPCDASTENAPTMTGECEWPLVYASLRGVGSLTSFTVAERSPETCVGVLCSPQVSSAERFPAVGTAETVGTQSGSLGDIAFADDSGDLLYVLQTLPGALLRIDTSLDDRGIPRNRPIGAGLELCDSPSRMEVWREEGLAFVTCFRPSLLFAIDLHAFQVIETVATGGGPNDMALDKVRRVLYVGNTLESSVSIIHLDRGRKTFLKEVARLGLQEPFSQ